MNRKNKKIFKRVISLAIATVLLLNSTLVYELSDFIGLDGIDMIAHAAVPDIDPDPTITTVNELINYSEVYRDHPANHQFDTVTIGLTGDTSGAFSDFVSIGTSEYPFGGKIVINSISSSDVMNLNTAFFDYVYDYAEIEGQGDRVFTLATTSDNTTSAIFANHVMHDNGNAHSNKNGECYAYSDDDAETQNGKIIKNYAAWTLRTANYSSTPYKHGALIGEIQSGAKVTINLANNATGNIESAGDTGLICGTMASDSKIIIASIRGSAAASITSSSGNAGGLVGTMNSGSMLTISGSSSDYVSPTSSITATSGYAGGLVGYNDRATVTGGYTTIKNTVKGSLGAGGLYGYYKPIMTSSVYSLNLNDFTIGDSSTKCTVSSSGGAGGFFGVLENPGGTITLTGTASKTIYSKGSTDNTVFGGVVGTYKANSLSDTLFVGGGVLTTTDPESGQQTTTTSKLTVNTDRSNNLSYYGGVIGKVDGAYFVNVSDVDVSANNANDDFFGGAVACADTGYVYVNNLTLTASSYQGGAIVGHTTSGVVQIAGDTNLSNATSDEGTNYGQIVGYRDSALVFAESGWNLTRGTAVAADDIGSWGEVVRFKASDFTIGSVFDTYYDPSAESPVHYATLKGATITDGKIILSSKSTFATAALNMQLNGGDNTDVLKFSDTTNCAYDTLKSKSIKMTSSIDLSHTGMTGLTRDNGSRVQYAGTEFDGVSTNNKLTLAIGEGYEGTDSTTVSNAAGKGMIYRHRYNGLFGETSSDFTIKNVTVSGCVNTDDKAGESIDFYVGTAVGDAGAAFNASAVIVDSSTKITYGTANAKDVLYVGGLVGKMSAPGISTIGSSTASGTLNSTFSAKISGSAGAASVYVGGVCGYVGANGNISVHDIKITNEVSNSASKANQRVAGLFANIADGTNTLDLNGVTLEGLTVKGKLNAATAHMGGLLGYAWDGVTATFDNIKIGNHTTSSSTDCTLSNDSTTGNMAGLVYCSSGYWKVKKVEIDGLALSGSSISSFGMLVNKAYSADKALYLELPSGFTYTLKSVTGTAPAIYDELATYTKLADSIEENGNSVISINTKGTTKYSTQTDTTVHMTTGSCNTYQNQVTSTGFKKYNPNSRYYYNVDNYIGKSNTGAAALYLWGVYQYAHNTIRSNIALAAPTDTFSGTLDLDGYSYYPVDVSGTVNISGDVALHNKDIETIESASSGGSDSYARTTIKDTTNNSTTQHYLMHAGLFRNVSGTININGALAIDGTVPYTDKYCGALICGTIGGSTSGDAKITSNNSGASISLAGIKVHNKDNTYSPLLINNAGGYVVMEIYHVSADDEYSDNEQIATSLIGIVGSDTAEKVQVTFSDIKLDARASESTLSGLTDVYGTKKCLFTRATLLESLTYASGSGSFGVYNYEYGDDWASSTHDGNVTYGKEISSSDSKNYKKEFWYNNENHSSTNAHYTDPSTNNNCGNSDSTAPYDFSGFYPYVAVWGTQIGSSATKHQLNVNHTSATFSGCGTYNDPYVITAGTQLESISKILSGTDDDETFWLYYPDVPSDKWCESKTAHTRYIFKKGAFTTKEGNTVAATTNGKYYKQELFIENGESVYYVTNASVGTTIEPDVIRAYLAGAYYYLDNNVEINANDFAGLGSNSDDAYVFHGVIAGNGKTITNKTAAPLIYASNGCVIKNLTIKPDGITNSVNTANDQQFLSTGGASTYGALIGRVMGGDNIIDQVTVDTSSANVSAGNYLATVGSYVGVVVEGGVFFRSMDKVKNNVLFSGGNYAENAKTHLYCNPYIGRVINGFAVNETNKYSPYESGNRQFGNGSSVSGNATSLKNNNKNYSITDINPQNANKLSVSGTTVNVPDSQAFFIMSLIINCGLGTGGTNVVGYYKTNQITRHADYSAVGTDIKVSDYQTTENTIEDAKALFEATEEYLDYKKAKDNDNSTTPYLIDKYATADAKTLGSGSGFTLNVNDNIILPDGYKGIGNVFKNDGKLQLSLLTFDGKDKSISQNTTFYTYESGKDNYLPYNDSLVHGIGLFNNQVSSNNNTIFEACVLTGNVITGQYLDNNLVNEITHDNFTGLTAGMLIGTLDLRTYNAKIQNVYLQNTYCESVRDAAGMVGYLINAAKTFTIENTTGSSKDSYGIRVEAGTNAGGLVSRQGNYKAENNEGEGNITVNYAGRNFDFVSIISRSKGTNWVESGKTNSNDWTYGVGGLVGVARGGKTNNKNIKISNVKIGSDKDTSTRTVSCEYLDGNSTKYGKTYVGGIVGVTNRAPVTLENCEIYNINVYSSNYVGGVVGWAGTASNIALNNSKICNTLGENGAVIHSDSSNAGGVLGFCKNDSNPTFNVNNCIIDSYDIEGASSGGLLGDWESGGAFAVKNSIVNNCKITYSQNGGGIAGQLKKNLYGYNVRVSDITFTASGTAKQGYICGNRSGGLIKIVGFHRTGTITEAKLVGSATANATTGLYSMTDMYGSGGYVIFADYEGKSALAGANTTKSNLNYASGTHVTDYGASPYVTINPVNNTIDNNIGLLTGDGISKTAVNSILTDATAKKYQVAPVAYFKNTSDSSIKTDVVSSFSSELGEVITGKNYDFPILVVDDTTTAETVVNNYLGVLTNTTFDYSSLDSAVGTVTIKKCAYNNDTSTYTVGNSACLEISSGTFIIRKDSNNKEQYDTANENGQFTLIDVAFKNPSETGKVAYHLYVPVIVKKLLEYNFDIASSSGTNYDKTVYDGSYGNVLVENLGTPVTMEFRYTYLRTASEWTEEGEEGRNYNYPKKLEFKVTGRSFDTSTTQMVLVDVSRNGKEYYLDSLSTSGAFALKSGTEDTYVLDLSKFTDTNGSSFTPLVFDKLSSETLTFSDNSTSTYKTERYYLSIFTDSVINSAGNFYVTSQELSLDEYPSRRVECECIGKGPRDQHYNTNLILGDFYSHNLTVTAQTLQEKMDIANNAVTANLSDTIALNAATKDTISPFLVNTSVTIYQTMLVTLEKYDSNGNKTGQGVRYLNGATVNSYSIEHSSGSKTINKSPVIGLNYVELPNNENIRLYLKNGDVTITSNVTLEYFDEDRRNAEFPYKDESDVINQAGAIVKGYSSMSSKAETAAYSNSAVSAKDTTKRYYNASDSSAVLDYNASYPTDRSEDNQLGINSFEETGAPSIQTIGIYDVSKIAATSEDYGYILCEITLGRKIINGESYSNVSDISDYLTGFTICGKNAVETNGVVKYIAATSGDKYVVILDRSKVGHELSEDVYSIPIGFQVYTGNNTNFEKKEGGGLQYGNYKVTLTTTLLSSWNLDNGSLSYATNSKSQATDYVIYTNARVYTDLIK